MLITSVFLHITQESAQKTGLYRLDLVDYTACWTKIDRNGVKQVSALRVETAVYWAFN